MLWLPVTSATSGRESIAVADASVAAIERALLEPDAAYSHLLGALLVDPWFCRWASCNDSAVKSVAQLAEWMAEGFTAKLAAMPSPAQAWTRVGENDAVSLAQQAAAVRKQSIDFMAYGEEAAHSVAFYSQMLSAEKTDCATQPAGDYLCETPGIEWRVPRLVARLAKFDHLERNFKSELEQAKLDAMKELAYGASHEVNNPLANISGRAQAMLRDERDPRRRRLLTAMDTQALRAHEMISDLMLFARPPKLQREPTDVGKLLEQVAEELRRSIDGRPIEIAIQPSSEPLTAEIDATQVKVAVAALAQNGVDAVGSCGKVTLAAVNEDGCLMVRVVDTGPGIEPEVRCHMFDPFYSGREAGRGLGFGLSKCWRIAQQHGGSVLVEKTNGDGTVMAIRMPLGDEET